MTQRQKEMFNRELHEWKRQLNMRGDDNLPWEVLVMIAEEVRRNYK